MDSENLPALRDHLPAPAASESPITVYKTDKPVSSGLAIHRSHGMVQFQRKAITINGQTRDISAEQLMGMIKNITQTIGEYKKMDNPMKDYVIPGLRKIRRDMVNDLEHHFHIHWKIEEPSGECIFFV